MQPVSSSGGAPWCAPVWSPFCCERMISRRGLLSVLAGLALHFLGSCHVQGKVGCLAGDVSCPEATLSLNNNEENNVINLDR